VWVLREPDDARSVLIATELEHAGTPYRILTTHFTWSEHGQISDRQIADFRRLKAFLAEFPDYVLCGDFNAPRGRAMFSMFTDQLPVVDHLPAHVMTTIDPRHHRAGALDLAVDNIFSTRDYEVRDVQVLDDLSDHMGILASVGRLKDSPQ
jgi:endonuclease/exonuclease/phosphatase family metal-dependent hydrolase